MFLAGIQAEFGLGLRLKHSGVTALESHLLPGPNSCDAGEERGGGNLVKMPFVSCESIMINGMSTGE
jgi:hypothetical protein